MIDIINPMIKQFLPFAQERMGFKDPPRLFLRGSATNAANPLGKTAFYDPAAKAVTLYITNRHPKDVMRSLSHELVHHTQNCRGDFDNVGEMGEGYAQNDEHLREMEREAYEIGNMCFRDWEDSIKSTIYFEHLQKGATKTMSTKEWKNGELTTLLSEAFGFGFTLDTLNEEWTGSGVGHDPTANPEDEREAGEKESEGEELSKSELKEDSGEEEKRHYEDDDWSDKDHLDALLHHAHELRKDMDYDHDHEALQEDSGEDEKRHYEHDDWSDKDHLDALIHHAHELRKDMDYDHDHEDLEERVRKDSPDRVGGRVQNQDRRTKPVSEAQIREIAKRIIARMKEKKADG